MPSPDLALVVIRSRDIERAAAFYRVLGCEFVKHAHGKGPEHYASELGRVVFEVYPLSDGQPETLGTRLGFAVEDVERTFDQLLLAGGEAVSPVKESPWGLRAAIADPDGHRVELTLKE